MVGAEFGLNLERMQVGLIGSGRLGRHLAYWWSFHSVPFWHLGASHLRNEILDDLLPSTQALFLAVRDGQIGEWIQKLRLKGYNRAIFHFSGAWQFSDAWDIHPLASFGYGLWPPEIYSRLAWVASKKGTCDQLMRFFPYFHWPIVELPSLPKPLYHAMATMAAAGIPELVQTVAHFFQRLGLKDPAISLFFETIWQTGIWEKHPSGAWTRGDWNTVRSHEQTLENYDKNLASLYGLLADLAKTRACIDKLNGP